MHCELLQSTQQNQADHPITVILSEWLFALIDYISTKQVSAVYNTEMSEYRVFVRVKMLS